MIFFHEKICLKKKGNKIGNIYDKIISGLGMIESPYKLCKMVENHTT